MFFANNSIIAIVPDSGKSSYRDKALDECVFQQKEEIIYDQCNKTLIIQKGGNLSAL